MKRRAVIFDMDGVLIDSYHPHLEAWIRLGRKLGHPITEEQFIPTFGRRNPEIFHTFWPGVVPEADIPKWSDWKEATYREILLADFPAMDGARELLDALKGAGFALAVGSSGPPLNVSVAVEGLGRAHLFDATVNSTEVVEGKPHPQVFLRAAEKMGLAPRACAVVEDSLAGLEAARRAGMTPIGITGTFTKDKLVGHAALVVESLRELTPEIIAGLIDAHAAKSALPR
jgi:beta-phosphoglucomutase